ncbi:MAG: acetylglutamate kinase [Defluviitaleaceae bacterium]|nr:acetylglutamate kinase [Defluviitaleaceae bacterium]
MQANQAHILSEALPYIRQYHGKTIVVKYGGNAMQTDTLCRTVISDIVLLSLVGIRVVVVHGGGPEINDMLTKVGKESKFVNGLRYTDEETMEIVQMVLSGRVGKQLTQLISEFGGRALGLSGVDGRLIEAKQLDPALGLVGEITAINPEPVKMALESGYTPVISTIACGSEPGQIFNINADSAAAQLAIAVGAEKLILLTDVKGLLQDPKDESTLISTAHLPEIPQLIKSGIISGGMIPKVDCCVDAVRRGVPRAHILDGRMMHSILIELLSNQGIGTMIMP